MPNPMCRPPNPAAMTQFPHAAGPNSATAPASMKQIPITGTIRTENAPPVTNPVPYNSSQVPGSACHRPARYSATVNRPPTTMGGRKLRPNRRPGPDRMGSFTAYAFRTMADPPIASATIASPSQVASHSSGVGWRAARSAAASAVAPTATWPQPGTAVNDPGPGGEPQLGGGLARREERRRERGGPDRHLAPARHRGERPGAFHRLSDEAQVVERAVVQRPRSDHDTHNGTSPSRCQVLCNTK